MISLPGYFDGNTVQSFEKIDALKNQKLIITVLDEFIEDPVMSPSSGKSARGSLAAYANPDLIKSEETAWETAAVHNYDNT